MATLSPILQKFEASLRKEGLTLESIKGAVTEEGLRSDLPKYGIDGEIAIGAVVKEFRDSGWLQAPAPLAQSFSPLRKEMRSEFKKLQQTVASKEDVANIQKQVEKLQVSTAGITFTPSTYRARYMNLKPQTIAPWFQKKKIPVVQRNIKKKKVNVSLFALPPAPGSSETTIVQPWWNSIIEDLPDTPIELTDEHKHATIGTRKPDIIGWQRGKPHSSFYIVVIGELKARRKQNAKEEFEPDEMGQLESFMQDLIEKFQTHRAEITGFLSDGKLIQFFRLQQKDNVWRFDQTPVLNLETDGGKLLLGLLSTPPTSLGMIEDLVVKSEPVTIKGILGFGGSSVVFKGIHQNEEVVVKHFRPNSQNQLFEEVHNLKIVNSTAGLKDRVTQLVAVTDDQTALLLRPVGRQFDHVKDFATMDHFAQLIDIIEITHKYAGLVHRDITESNFFLSDDDTVFLNDWGCATPLNSTTPAIFSGSLAVAPRAVLDGICSDGGGFTYIPAARDDLEMIVKCFFGRLNAVCSTLPMQSGDISKDAQELLKFWDVQLLPSFWVEFLKMAKNCDYSGMKRTISALLV